MSITCESLTKENIKQDFQYFEPRFKNSGAFHNRVMYNDHRDSFDLWLNVDDDKIGQEQINRFNSFVEKSSKHMQSINEYLFSTLSQTEKKRNNKIEDTRLKIYVIASYSGNTKFDTVVICGKQTKGFLYSRKEVCIRAEIYKNNIMSMERTKDSLKENT